MSERYPVDAPGNVFAALLAALAMLGLVLGSLWIAFSALIRFISPHGYKDLEGWELGTHAAVIVAPALLATLARALSASPAEGRSWASRTATQVLIGAGLQVIVVLLMVAMWGVRW